jgi:predicted outer membrane protein
VASWDVGSRVEFLNIATKQLIDSGALGEVSNEDLKKFIDDAIPMMKGHLEMAKKMATAK